MSRTRHRELADSVVTTTTTDQKPHKKMGREKLEKEEKEDVKMRMFAGSSSAIKLTKSSSSSSSSLHNTHKHKSNNSKYEAQKQMTTPKASELLLLCVMLALVLLLLPQSRTNSDKLYFLGGFGALAADAQLKSNNVSAPIVQVTPAAVAHSSSSSMKRDLSFRQLQQQQLRQEQELKASATRKEQAAAAKVSNVCQVKDGESVAIVEMEESRGSDMSQPTNPVELPISGSAKEIELKIESETHKYFRLEDKRLKLIQPLDRDAQFKENSTQILHQPISSIYLQISCLDKRDFGGDKNSSTPIQRKVIVPVLVKVLDLNDNAPKFTQQTYIAQVDELTPVDSIVFDQIQAIDLDSANNGLVDYGLVSPPTSNVSPLRQTHTIPEVTPTSSVPLASTVRLVQRAQSQTVTPTPITVPSITTQSPATVATSTLPTQLIASSPSATSSMGGNLSPPGGATINLNSEPIMNGPMEESDEEESDESLLASLNSTDLNGGGDGTTDSDSVSLMRFKPTRARRRRRSSENLWTTLSEKSNQRWGAATTLAAFGHVNQADLLGTSTTSAASSRDSLWTNLMANDEPMLTVSGDRQAPPSNRQLEYSIVQTNLQQSNFVMRPLEPTIDEFFSLEFAPGSSRPVIKLKKPLDYESRRTHLLTIQASDKASNKQDRLASHAQVIIRVLDGDDQGPAFVLDQSGCATNSPPQTTVSSLASKSNRFPSIKRKRELSDLESSSQVSSTSPSAPASKKEDETPTTTTPTPTTTITISSSTSTPAVSSSIASQVNVPKGFKISDENFEFGDMSSGEDLPFSDGGGLIGGGDSHEDGDEDFKLDAIVGLNSTNNAGIESKLLLKLLQDPAAAPSSGGRARRYMTTVAPPGGGEQHFKQSSKMTPTQLSSFDYSCLAQSPLSSFNGKTPEYYSTVMSGESDYVLKIAPQAIKARDRDELNAQIKYTFINGTPSNYSSYFQINPLDATVKQIAPVERAQIGKFVIWIQAQEQTYNKLSSLAKFTIEIIPTDKNPPVLVPNSYAGFVEENSPIGTLISAVEPGIANQTNGLVQHLRISVIDEDLAIKATTGSDNYRRSKQLYEFETTSDAFKVNNDGFVFVNRWPLDRDVASEAVHMFQVTARQLGLASSSARSISSPVSINVTLIDLNDNPPIIANSSLVPIQLVAGGGAESRPVRPVTTIRAIDRDLAENARMWFSIYHVSNNGRDRFRLNEESGELEALGKFNAGEQFSLTLQVSDEFQRTNQGILEIFVVPGPNTGGPQFVFDPEPMQHGNSLQLRSGTGYSVEVNEGIAPHSAILQLQARDPENDPISFSIIDGNVNNDFSINSKTGTIYVANKLDREEVSAYNLMIQARDSGGLASNRPVYIQITDNNDQNPIFNQTHYLFSCYEGQANQVLGRVLATDSDSGENGIVSYQLESPAVGLDGKGQFAIDEKTGELRVLEALDYEQAKSHALIVKARDSGETPRSTTVGVVVRVIDVQDEKPFFERNHIELRVAENLGSHKIAQVQARDLDSVSQITYELKLGDPSLFQVDPSTGIVTTSERGLDYEESKSHFILIGTVEASPPGNVPDNYLFDWANLLLRQQHQLIDRSPVVRIDIQVVDMNDNAPQFKPAQPLPVRVQDSAQLGALVTRLLAEDADGSEANNQLRYELVTRENAVPEAGSEYTRSEKCAQWFMVDATSGAVSLRSDLRRDSQSECHLVVRARDSGTQPSSLSALSQLTVFIDHIAELSPSSMIAFGDSHFTVELEENAPARFLVKTLPTINKPKGGINFPMSCEILSGNELGKFTIEENEARDCELRIRDYQTIDYELKQRYTLTVRLNTIGSGAGSSLIQSSPLGGATSPVSGAGGSARALAQVNVNIVDRNDNRPTFHQPARYNHLTQGKFLAALATDAPSETQVVQLRATDADSPHSNGLISYEILNDNELENRFKIDPVDGIVRNSRPVEDIPSTRLPLRLKVMARDNPELLGDSLNSIAEVVINLIDDRHRIALVLKDTATARALDSKEELLGTIQERTGLISGLEKAESLKIHRNGTLEPDVSGTDFWFYLIEPGTLRIVQSDDPRLKALLDPKVQQHNPLLDVIGQTLGFTKARLRLPYSLSYGSSGSGNLNARASLSMGVFSFAFRPMGNSFASALILVALFIALVGAIVVIYQCGSWSSYSRATKEKLFLHQQQQQQHHHQQQQNSYYQNYGNFPGFQTKSSQRSLIGAQDPMSTMQQQINNQSLMPQLINASRAGTTLESIYQQLDLQQQQQQPNSISGQQQQQQQMGKEYETQMLKMSVLFDDSNSLDEQNLNFNSVSHQQFT